MFFGKKREKMNSNIHNRIKFEEVDLLVLENGGIHLELKPKTGILKYRNVISYADVGMNFPEGYFDEETFIMTSDSMDQIAFIFDKLFQKRYPESNLEYLPPGATHDAYMRIQSKGRTLYYTNTHVRKNGSVKSEPVAEEYIILVHLLKQYCDFSQFIPITSDEISKIVGYRFSATGVFGYDFYKEKRKLCSVSSVVIPLPPVMMYGFGNEWISEFEDGTIFPGLTRYVYDRRTGKKIFKIVYIEEGKYEINDLVIVYCNEERYAFYRDNQLIVQMNKKTDKSGFVPQSTGYEVKPYFDVFVQKGIDEDLLMLIFSFPMLKFAL